LTLSEHGLALLKHSEGFSAYAYPDGDGFSIGYGHHGKEIEEGSVVTPEEAAELLQVDIQEAELVVNQYVKVPLKQEQFDALVNLIYNIGVGAFVGSTLLQLLNEYQYERASREFTRWDKSGGKQLAGLTARREAEMRLFNGESA